MSDPSISVFTPSNTPPEDLEFILVQRQAILEDAVERVRESALTAHKHHLLFVGPRGCGKSHLITLIVHRVGFDETLVEHLRIAWLNEDETCTSLLEFLLKIHAALEKRYPEECNDNMLAPAFEMKPDAALEFISKHVLEILGSRTLMVAAENLDAIFENLGDIGQKQLRAFIQENPKLTIVATAQRLVESLSDRTNPFYGFFQTEHLKPLNVEDATELLKKIARLRDNAKVEEFLTTRRGRSRIQALHHLSGGNHRIYIVLSQFITRDSINALVGPFMKMVDELTPYYQERIRWLPPLQRRIVEFLCTCETTVPVKEIAKRLFSSSQTISSQLQALREKGYIEASQRGRESLYEISEPMMRICVEVKENQRFKPLRLLVDFLRVWYDDHELLLRLGQSDLEGTSKAHLESAIERNQSEGNLRHKILLNDLLSLLPGEARPEIKENLENLPEAIIIAFGCMAKGEVTDAIYCLDEEISTTTAVSDKIKLLSSRAGLHKAIGDTQGEIQDYTAVIELSGTPSKDIARALINRGVALGEKGNHEEEIHDYTSVINLPGAPVDQISKAFFNRAVTRGQAGDREGEIQDYTATIELPGAPVDHVARALLNRGVVFGKRGDIQNEIRDYTAIIKLSGAPADQISKAFFNRGFALGQAGDREGEIQDYTATIELSGASPDEVAKALLNRGITLGQAGDVKGEIRDYTAAIELPGVPARQIAEAHFNRGVVFGKAGDFQKEIHEYTAAIELPDAPADQVARTLVNRGAALSKIGDSQGAIDNYTAAIELDGATTDQVAKALLNRALKLKQTGDRQSAIRDYTAVVNLTEASSDQVAKALLNRGFLFGEAGDSQNEIHDYTAVIDLPNAPVNQVAKALFNRGVTLGKTGDSQAEIRDYTATIELPGAPAVQVAKALFNRAVTLGEAGDNLGEINDYTRLIELPGALADQVARALLYRGIHWFQADRKSDAIVDLKAVTQLENAQTETVVDAFLALSEIYWSDTKWHEGFQTTETGLEYGRKEQPPYFGTSQDLIRVLFVAGLSSEARCLKVAEFFGLYQKHDALSALGDGLVKHVGKLFQAGAPFPSSDNLNSWADAWERVSTTTEEFRLPLRLLRTGVSFLIAGGKDLGILLDLTSPERNILTQALGLAE